MKRMLLPALIFLLVILAAISPAAAEPFMAEPLAPDDSLLSHTVSYTVTGKIDFKKQAGHLCNTGAEMLQTITGEGELVKTATIVMESGILTVSDNNDFITAIDAVKNLTVTTAIELCSPPKISSEVVPVTYYDAVWTSTPLLGDSLWEEHWRQFDGLVDYYYYGQKDPADIVPAWRGNYNIDEWEGYDIVARALTEQIWATSISADPGHSGTLNHDFKAAYEPSMQFLPRYVNGLQSAVTTFDSYIPLKTRRPYYPWYYRMIHPNYRGDYFTIDQYTYVSQGELKRYIDISNPRSHALLYEEMTVNGFSEISESFTAVNMPAGSNETGSWWNIFDLEALQLTEVTAKDLYMEHDVQYGLNGVIDFKKQAGHLCNTGAEMLQTITGEGEIAKKSDIHMIQGLLVVDDKNDFTTALNASANLTVSTAIELCAPPKQIFDEEVSAPMLYPIFDGEGFKALIFKPYKKGDVINPLLSFSAPLMIDDIFETNQDYINVSNQIWAVSVSADAGNTGVLNMSFEAAHGQSAGYIPFHDDRDSFGFLRLSPYRIARDLNELWWIGTDGKGIFPVIGADYVGNYFNIEQVAGTSSGVLKRYIDISSPWNHGYLHEDMTVSGKAEVSESFEMKNLPAGSAVDASWWTLFGFSGAKTYSPLYEYYLTGEIMYLVR